MLSAGLGELRASYPPTDEIVLASEPECVKVIK